MTPLELLEAGLHNTHIRFLYYGHELSGVLIDDKNFRADEKYLDTQYIYIPTLNLIDYQKASAAKDLHAMKQLSRIIDISAITNAERVIY